MPRGSNQKFKLYRLAQIMMEQTDDEHYITMPEIKEALAEYDITADRKSLYNDLRDLEILGIEVEGEQDGNRYRYHVVNRPFELPELKLLVDAIQSSKFITTTKSRELIHKLESFVSNHDARKLQRQVVVIDRNKTINETIYYSVDMIYAAISSNVQIRFQYFDWDVHKQMKLRKDGAFYEVSPWLLTWDDENYYLVAYDFQAGILKHYRVDKMLRLSLTDDVREGKECFDKLDVAAYSKKTFGMFAGEEKTIQLLCDQTMTGVIIDRFGSDVAIRPKDDTHILVRVNVAVSPQFYGWLSGLSGKVCILSPSEIALDYQKYLQNILDSYKNNC